MAPTSRKKPLVTKPKNVMPLTGTQKSLAALMDGKQPKRKKPKLSLRPPLQQKSRSTTSLIKPSASCKRPFPMQFTGGLSNVPNFQKSSASAGQLVSSKTTNKRIRPKARKRKPEVTLPTAMPSQYKPVTKVTSQKNPPESVENDSPPPTAQETKAPSLAPNIMRLPKRKRPRFDPGLLPPVPAAMKIDQAVAKDATDAEISSEKAVTVPALASNESPPKILPSPGISRTSEPAPLPDQSSKAITSKSLSVEEKVAAIWKPMPRPEQSKDDLSKSKKSTGNFVRQNLRNGAGSCLGARNKKSKTKSRLLWEQRKKDRGEWREKRQTQGTGSSRSEHILPKSGIDPVDDYVDGVYNAQPKKNSKTKKNKSAIPVCSGHQRPCKQLIVKKSGPNKGRTFYCCASPREEQCNHFQWADDTVQAARAALLKNSSRSGFIARQVAAYRESIKDLTVPELKVLVNRQGLSSKGKKGELLTRISLWVRDQISSTLPEDSSQDDRDTKLDENGKDGDCAEATTPSSSESDSSDSDGDGDDDDDSSVSSGELEILEKDDPRSDDEVDVNCPQSKRLYKALRQFGHSRFREGQEWCISRCLSKERTLFVAPTGFGKSLCYALPASMLPGVCIVVSPLLALIQDQLRVLPPRVPAATLSGSSTAAQMASTLDDILRGRIKIVFVSPERLTSNSFKRLFRLRWNASKGLEERKFPPVSLLCVDEAHCVSQWGHNFRPAYLRLKSMVNMIRPESVLAVTATAGPQVMDDICQTLSIQRDGGGDEAGVMAMSSNRNNIGIDCMVLSSHGERIEKLNSLLLPCKKKVERRGINEGALSEGSVIVYVWRQLDAEAVAENIQAAGVEGGVVVYHAGMDSGLRARAQSKFMRGKARICVATVAFGLGINKSDIRGVIHLHLPASPEHYLQEIGRAGRDGDAAHAFALVLENEVLVRHSLAHSDLVSRAQLRLVFSRLRSELLDMRALADEFRSKTGSSIVGIPVESSSVSCGVKSETLETLMTMLENKSPPLLHVEGMMYDKASISPRRCSLSDLAEKEPVAAAVLKCSTCTESTVGEGRAASEVEGATNQGLVGRLYGSYSFSVTQCAYVLGQDAEPRHVFAALRRLEETGVIEFVLDTTAGGRALTVNLTNEGLEVFGSESVSRLDELSSWAHERGKAAVQLASGKVLDMNCIIQRLARMDCGKPDGDSSDELPPKLKTFQALVKEYFEAEGKDQVLTMEDSFAPDFVEPPSDSRLLVDIQSARSMLRDAVASTTSGDASPLLSDNSETADCLALLLAKFLHGISPSFLPPRVLRSHPLFGRYQTSRFATLHKSIQRLTIAD